MALAEIKKGTFIQNIEGHRITGLHFLQIVCAVVTGFSEYGFCLKVDCKRLICVFQYVPRTVLHGVAWYDRACKAQRRH